MSPMLSITGGSRSVAETIIWNIIAASPSEREMMPFLFLPFQKLLYHFRRRVFLVSLKTSFEFTKLTASNR
jgi:hypothetical protein